MGEFNTIHTNFTAGEISPKMFGRVDVARYNSGAALMSNFMIYPQGGATRRMGTYYAATVKNSANPTFVLEFEFSDLQAYILEFGDTYIRFYQNNGPILVSSIPYEIASPYAAADLSGIWYFQSADQVFLLHANYPPQILTRLASNSWTIAPIVFTDGPYLAENTTSTTLGYTFSTTTLAASTAVFVSTDVGRLIRIAQGSAWYWGIITAFTNSTHVTVSGGNLTGNVTATTQWRLGSFSVTTGYPEIGVFHQQRLALANTATEPETVWLSVSNQYYTFSDNSLVDSTVVASNALYLPLASNQVNAVRWMESASALLVGTQGAEWAIQPASTASPLSSTNVQTSQQSGWGGKKVRTKRIGYSTMFTQKTGNEIKEIAYDIYVNGYNTKSPTLLSEHILREGGGVIAHAYTQQPFLTEWFLRADGILVGFTYSKEQDIYGWHSHIIGGTYNGGNAIVESIAAIPTPDGIEDQLWMVVKRTVNGSTVRYIEYMTPSYNPVNTQDKSNMVFTDASLTYNGSPITVVTGINHLIGQSVNVLGDGKFIGTFTVDNSGNVTFPPNVDACSIITVGLPYTSIVGTLRTEGGGDKGTAQGKIKRSTKYIVRLYNSLGFEVSSDNVNWNYKSVRDTSQVVNQSPDLVTGDIKDFSFDDYTFNGQIYFRQSKPYPLSILAVMLEMQVNK
jgi:hypothetical protein